jgi:hypothetical protein
MSKWQNVQIAKWQNRKIVKFQSRFMEWMCDKVIPRPTTRHVHGTFKQRHSIAFKQRHSIAFCQLINLQKTIFKKHVFNWRQFEASAKAEHFSQFREAFKNCSSELFFWPFERLILIFSAIFWYCMITRQLIVKKINYARNSKKKFRWAIFEGLSKLGKVFSFNTSISPA